MYSVCTCVKWIIGKCEWERESAATGCFYGDCYRYLIIVLHEVSRENVLTVRVYLGLNFDNFVNLGKSFLSDVCV